MIKQSIYLEKYAWTILAYYCANSANMEEVCEELAMAGCNGKKLKEACDLCELNRKNTGLTYSNIEERKSVVIIGETTSWNEFVNSVSHEMLHVVSHLCQAEKIDMNSEEPCYIMGWLCQAVSTIFI